MLFKDTYAAIYQGDVYPVTFFESFGELRIVGFDDYRLIPQHDLIFYLSAIIGCPGYNAGELAFFSIQLCSFRTVLSR